jgi:type IV pilus assembly protein PilO
MNSTARKILFVVIIAGLLYVSYAYMIKPANAELVQQRAKVVEKGAKLAKLNRAPAAVEDMQKQLARLEEGVTFLESKLPPKSEIHTVLENVTLIAQKQGLITKSIRTLKQKNNNGYIEQPLKMELNGDFDAYYSFLLELEKIDRITKIQELSLKKDSKNEGHAHASFVMSIFFQDSGA